jgi:hypothetical protein
MVGMRHDPRCQCVKLIIITYMNVQYTGSLHWYEFFLERLCKACRFVPYRVRYILAAGVILPIFSFREDGTTYMTVALPYQCLFKLLLLFLSV